MLGFLTHPHLNFFLDAYINSPKTHEIESKCLGANPDELVNMFNGVCANILDAVAPFKLKKHRSCVHPWLNDETILDRNGEKQKGSGRGVYYKYHMIVFKSVWFIIKKLLRLQKQNIFSDLFSKNTCSPKILFNTSNSVLNPMSILLTKN